MPLRSQAAEVALAFAALNPRRLPHGLCLFGPKPRHAKPTQAPGEHKLKSLYGTMIVS